MTIIRQPKPNAPSPIQCISSASVSVFWLNQEQVRGCLKSAVERLAQCHPEIEEVWLFGSLARGDALPGSDADLLIVLRESQTPFLDRSVRYQPDFCGVGVDVLAYTRPELAHMQAEGNALLQRVQSEGILLFRRAGRREKSSEPA